MRKEKKDKSNRAVEEKRKEMKGEMQRNERSDGSGRTRENVKKK